MDLDDERRTPEVLEKEGLIGSAHEHDIGAVEEKVALVWEGGSGEWRLSGELVFDRYWFTPGHVRERFMLSVGGFIASESSSREEGPPPKVWLPPKKLLIIVSHF